MTDRFSFRLEDFTAQLRRASEAIFRLRAETDDAQMRAAITRYAGSGEWTLLDVVDRCEIRRNDLAGWFELYCDGLLLLRRDFIGDEIVYTHHVGRGLT